MQPQRHEGAMFAEIKHQTLFSYFLIFLFFSKAFYALICLIWLKATDDNDSNENTNRKEKNCHQQSDLSTYQPINQ